MIYWYMLLEVSRLTIIRQRQLKKSFKTWSGHIMTVNLLTWHSTTITRSLTTHFVDFWAKKPTNWVYDNAVTIKWPFMCRLGWSIFCFKVGAVQRRAARYVAINHRNRYSVSHIIQRLKFGKNDIFLVSIREDGIWNDLLCDCLVFRPVGISLFSLLMATSSLSIVSL
jgi:hypothetical protein